MVCFIFICDTLWEVSAQVETNHENFRDFPPSQEGPQGYKNALYIG